MEFDIEKEREEIGYLNAKADEHIRQGEELNKKAQITITKLKTLMGMQ